MKSPSAQRSNVQALKDVFRYRMLVATLVGRELKARYRGSFLGFVWTLLNPLLLMGVYALVFRYYMRFDVDNYAVFLLCGILPWTYFSTSLNEGVNSVLSGGSLITKSLFPPHILPSASVIAQLVNYLLSLPILVLFLVIYGISPGPALVALPFVLALQTVFTWGLVLILAALNVHYRDVQHVLGNVLLLWFFLSPILYPVSRIPESLRFVQYLNPMGLAIEAYHAMFLFGRLPDWRSMALLAAFTIVAVVVGGRVFDHYRETFPELV